MIDLRSDTVTLPNQRMRDAMAAAELGDDVMGEDPTVNRLEGLASEKFGKEASLFVASGTMGNLVSLLAHCNRGQEVILGDRCHIFSHEAGGASTLGGIPFHPVPTGRFGELAVDDIRRAARPPNVHYAPAGLICLENTHNRCGGTVLSVEYLASIRLAAQSVGLPIHMDGSRIFNAAMASGCDVHEFSRTVDSIQFCLSKGLGAPVGSLVCGKQDFVARARKYRKMLGGGMRQAGVVAAAGIVALDEMVERLETDHRRARRIAEALADLPGVCIDLDTVQTNLIIFTIPNYATTAIPLTDALKREGVRIGQIGDDRYRMVTHVGITDSDIDAVLKVLGKVWQALPVC